MNKHFRFSRIIILVISFVMVAFFMSVNAFADGEAFTGGDGTGGTSCNATSNFCTPYGAAWVWYPHDYNNPTDGVIYLNDKNQDKVIMVGNKANSGYAHTTTISGCSEYGGYWRYAMISYGSYKFHQAYASYGVDSFRVGIQVGTININGGVAGWDYLSSRLGGGMAFRGISIYDNGVQRKPDASKGEPTTWEELNELYNVYMNLKKGTRWSRESDLAVFCGRKNNITYTLSATPKDIDTGATLPKFKSGAIWSATAEKDESAMVGAGYDSSQEYEFVGWKEKLSDSALSTTNANHMINGDKYTENKMTGDKEVFAMYRKIRTLTVEGKNIHNNSDVNDGDQSKRGSGTVTAARNIVENYHFIGWKENPSIGTENILDNTDTNRDVYVSGGGTYTYDNGTKDIFLNLSANVGRIGNKTVYAYYTPECKLGIERDEGAIITVERTSSIYDNPRAAQTWYADSDIDNPWTLYKGDKLKVTFGVKKGYALVNASIGGDILKPGGENIYEVPGNEAGVCEVNIWGKTEKIEFEGRSRVGGDMSVSTGWTKTNNTKTYNIDNCDPLNGCEVKFDHSLRRTSGTGSVKYSITRTYFGEDEEKIISNQSVDPGDGTIVRSQNDSRITIRPGQKVCEKMIFKPNEAGSDAMLEVCAVASGSAQGNAHLLLDMKISKEKNQNGEYINYTDEIYVKPGDNIRYRAIYHPVLQYAYGIKPQKIEINGDLFNNPANSEHGCMLSNYYDLGGFFGNCQKDFWKNAFTMYSKMNPSSRSVYAEKDYEYSAGDTSEQREFRDKKVGNDDVGNELIGYAEINKNNNTRATPTSITFSYKDGYSVATVNVDRIKKTAKAVVPYNFENSVEIDGDGGIVYAGETAKITSTVTVNPKTNSLTTDGSDAQKYATKVPEAKVTLKLKYSNGEESSDEKTKTNFSNSAPYDMTVNIKDLPAGTTIEAQACVYPASSGDDNNWEWDEIIKNNDEACSASKTYVVAKRPSFQVWGGGVYSNGGITAPSSIKNNLDGVYAYNVNSSSGTTVFGSWAEQAVVSNGAVNGLASGAATGLNITLNGMLVNGGIVEKADTDFCDNRVPLSFANYLSGGGGCPYQPQTGQLGAANNALDRRALINYIIGDTGAEVIKLQSSDGNYILDNRSEYGGDIVGQGITRVVVVASTNEDGSSGAIVPGTITIVSNKYYERYDEPHYYSTLTEIPKLIIYAENINIACNVTRLDAILIAEDTITTCPSIKKNDEGELIPLNEPGNSTPLTVNGIIIANKLELNRTYGAATGVNSGVPAEIVNHDSSTVLWSKSQVDTDDYSGLSIIYQHELAPRY